MANEPTIEPENEIWSEIEGYNGFYDVSNFGNVRVRDRYRNSRHGLIRYSGKALKPKKSKYGYLSVNLCKDGNAKMKYVHVLVAKAFVDGFQAGYEVNHEDGNKGNNHYKNLTWCTHPDNLKHAHKIGLCLTPKGFHHPRATLKQEQYSKIISLLSEGKCVNEISNITGIKYNIVYRIVNGISYTYFNQQKQKDERKPE